MKHRRTRTPVSVATAFALTIALTACGGDDDTPSEESSHADAAAVGDRDEEEAAAEADEGSADMAGGGGGQGSMAIDGEDVTLNNVTCQIEDPPSSSIDALVLAWGVTTSGESVAFNFSRLNATSGIEGDEVRITVGEDDEGTEYGLSFPLETVSVTDGGASASDLTLETYNPAGAMVLSFEITC
ncbi:hypothetical protein MWU75_10070 [Ornithinimicrobium sp. F0845]|uniref:hypothetical protein n=1 Tax=Ornithinimicrobium sp. F0845 TaxID=2926412 RepID=UPI001FF5A2BA|nr:hypothetical protein [Ornithinimicrobium sp. F0845]MCK0112483.1 hypothetical protein [Ornithinimicrobium sp. F0845]